MIDFSKEQLLEHSKRDTISIGCSKYGIYYRDAVELNTFVSLS